MVRIPFSRHENNKKFNTEIQRYLIVVGDWYHTCFEVNDLSPVRSSRRTSETPNDVTVNIPYSHFYTSLISS